MQCVCVVVMASTSRFALAALDEWAVGTKMHLFYLIQCIITIAKCLDCVYSYDEHREKTHIIIAYYIVYARGIIMALVCYSH